MKGRFWVVVDKWHYLIQFIQLKTELPCREVLTFDKALANKQLKKKDPNSMPGGNISNPWKSRKQHPNPSPFVAPLVKMWYMSQCRRQRKHQSGDRSPATDYTRKDEAGRIYVSQYRAAHYRLVFSPPFRRQLSTYCCPSPESDNCKAQFS